MEGNKLKILCYCDQKLVSLDGQGGELISAEINPPVISATPLQLWGSCNGLLCMSDNESKTMHVWNPFTGECTQIPNIASSPKDNVAHYVAFGVGYNATANDYEIVRVLSYCSGNNFSEVQVYSLRKNTWRKIGYIGYRIHHCNYNSVKGRFVDGAIHWVATQTTYWCTPYTIIAYCIKDRKFRQVQLPYYGNKELLNINVTTLGEELCVYMHDTISVEAWIRKDSGLHKSWTKLFKILQGYTLDTYSLEPLCFANKGAEILLRDRTCFSLYHLLTKQLGDKFKVAVCQTTTYTESNAALPIYGK